MIDTINLVIGVGIIAINLIPFFSDKKYLRVTLLVSVLIVAIRVLFFR